MFLNKRILPKESLKAIFRKSLKALKTNKSMHVVFFDANGMKRVNDTYGHLVGDFVIKKMADQIVASVRESDWVIRFGGDEFILFLPNSSEKVAETIVGRVQKNIRTDKEIISKVKGISISAGVVRYRSSTHKKVEDILEIADFLMYKAKKCPPRYVAFCKDTKLEKKEEKRDTSKEGNKLRSYFAWVTSSLLEDDPAVDLDSLVDASREIWRKYEKKILDISPRSLEKTIKTNYAVKKKKRKAS